MAYSSAATAYEYVKRWLALAPNDPDAQKLVGDCEKYSISFSPAKSKNFLLYCSGDFIGGLFDEELCFVYTDSVSELLGQPEPVYCGGSSTAQHRMLVIPEEHWEEALKLLYAEKFDWSRLVYDITYNSIGAAVVEDFYDENVVFLYFCFEKDLLKKNPLDRQGRILRMVYLNQDLTETGKVLFPRLLQKFLVFTDRGGKTSLEKEMLCSPLFSNQKNDWRRSVP